MGITTASARLQEKIKQEIIRIFAANGLSLTIDINLRSVQFLDVCLDLETGIFKPFIKPGDRPKYVNAQSNHPPLILKNLPLGINKRLSSISANKHVFDQAAPIYQEELDRCGYTHKLEFQPPAPAQQGRKRSRSRQITWFNPPYSMDVETNVGRKFLALIDKHFPPGHILHPVINRSTVKVSYRCLPNMGSIIAKHNSKILKKEATVDARTLPRCSCQKSVRESCPVPGACDTNGVVYQTTINSNDDSQESYIGLAKNFKKRYRKHKTSMKEEDPENSTTLSTYFWKKKKEGKEPTVSWKFLETEVPVFNPVFDTCKLCVREKFNIAFKPELATLNSRGEMFAHCRHKQFQLLIKRPPG